MRRRRPLFAYCIHRNGSEKTCQVRNKGSQQCRYRGDIRMSQYKSYRGQTVENLVQYRDMTADECQAHSSSSCSGVTIYSRSRWGARSPRYVPALTRNPVDLFFIHHTAGYSCHDFNSCARRVRGIQNYHMGTRDWADIGYSFLVGEDGNVYEGRGWGKVGAHTRGYNDKSYAVAVMGYFKDQEPNSEAQEAVKALIQCGISEDYISSDYKLYGHRDAVRTSCPGNAFYDLIRTWSHYSTEDP